MILKRRDKKPFWGRVKNYVWPQMGWSRFLAYVKKRIIRLSDTPHNIALGIAFGLACSFNPYVGTHIIQAAALALLFRANVPASALGTLLGNPSTFPFLWWIALVAGQAFLTALGFDVDLTNGQGNDSQSLLIAAKENPAEALLPWTVGGYLVGIATIPICYFIAFPLIKTAKAARGKMIAAKKAFGARHKKATKQQEDTSQ